MAYTFWPALAACVVTSLLQTPPVPKPFPGAAGAPTKPPVTAPAQPDPQPPATAAPPAVASQPAGVPTEATLNAPIYPTADYLESFDAGRGQRYYLFGTNAAFSEIVGYYKNRMKNGGRTLFEAPAMQQWDLAKFQDDTMAFTPSIVVKDYAWNGAEGYLFVDGTSEKRYKTIIQIVPAAPAVIK